MKTFLSVIAADVLGVLGQLSAAGRKFGHRPKMSPLGITVLLVIVILILAAVAVHVARRMFAAARQPGPQLALFLELARAHGLTPADQRLLRKLARREKLDNPAKVFVERRLLEACARSAGNPAWRRLFEKLFGG